MDTSTICPICMREDAVSGGYCRCCRKKIKMDIPAGLLPPGVVLNGRYLTGYYLGYGGFGAIYRALDITNGTLVAIKEYYPSLWCHRTPGASAMTVTHTEEFSYGVKHFRGEAEILQSLQDIPEVVRFYHFFYENNTAYYVMEYLDGDTLQKYLNKNGEKISYASAVKLLMPAILGMHKVHQTGTLHRDISPDNLFLCRDGSIRIIDFGASAAKTSKYSMSFMPVEKEGYSPPEQHTISTRGDTQRSWSDIYAMAGTLYRCVIGKRPPASSSRQAGDQLEFDHSGLSAVQIRILERNLSLKAEERCETMQQFAVELLGGLKDAEADALRTKYPILTELQPPSHHAEPPKPVPAQSTGRLRRAQALAFCLDMLFFQGLPFASCVLFGGNPWLRLGLGLMIGILCGWLLTVSVGGSPGELICGLKVLQNGKKPQAGSAFLYCLLRSLWPLKPADWICLLASGKTLSTAFSGCASSLRDGSAAAGGQRELCLRITEGLYQGSVIPLKPGEYTVGRNPDICNLVYPMTYNVVSRVHFILTFDTQNRIRITNRSGNGTWIDSYRLDKDMSAWVSVGNVIAFGKEKILVTYM